MDSIQKYISDKDETPWRVFVFKAYDNWMEQNCEQAPKQLRFWSNFPRSLLPCSPFLKVKNTYPRTMVFTKECCDIIWDWLCPMTTPATLLMGAKKYNWKEGKGVLFDDTFRHEVWNESEHTRVVLFCDVYRERMPWLLRVLNRWVYQMRVKSKRLKKAVAKAEVPVTID